MASAQFHGGNPHISYGQQDTRRVEQLFGLNHYIQLLVGQIPVSWPSWLPAVFSPWGWLLARLYCVLVIACSLHLGLLFTKTMLDALPTGQLADITDALTMIIIYFFTAYATSYWLYRSQQLQQYLEQFNQAYRHHSLAGVCFVSSHGAYVWTRNFSIVWITACFVAVVFWGITPMFTGMNTLPLRCWYPFDVLAPEYYPYIYAIQLYAQIVNGVTFGVVGALFVSLCVLILAQFDVLYCSLKNLDAHARLISGETLNGLRELQCEMVTAPEVEELNQYAILKEHPTNLQNFNLQRQSHLLPRMQHSKALHKALIECVHLHRFILSSCSELERLFNPYCLIKSMQITIQLCLLVFVGVSGERNAMRAINQVQYLSLTFFELMMFTYCGELLRRHSVRAGEAYWRSPWWRHAHHIRQDVLIFLVNSRRAVQVTAGKFYVMDVNRLRSVVTQAFSFLTLLQKLAAKK